jgi:Flp pilus assembly protein TadG
VAADDAIRVAPSQPPRSITVSRRGERGSAAIETAIGVPTFILFIGLIIAGGRTAMTHESLQSAAADAARAASIDRDPRSATIDAQAAAAISVSAQGIGCHDVETHVDTASFDKQPGQSGSVTVTISCRLDLSDLSVPGVPGSRVLTATMSSPLDTWRQS